jgi:serum/glucocorticoid-regulated kinase 2
VGKEPEIIPIDSREFIGPGTLKVDIHIGVDLAVPQTEPARDYIKEKSDIECASLPGYLSLPYAILECDGSQVTVNANSGTTENPVWAKYARDRSFDIFTASDVKIRLYVRNRRESQDVFLGCTKMKCDFRDDHFSQTEWLPIENGIGKLLVEVKYSKIGTLRIETRKSYTMIGKSRLDYIYKTRTSKTKRYYASIHISKVDLSPHCDVVRSFLSQINDSPFIAPLTFIAQTRSKFCLYWPFIPGGHPIYIYLSRGGVIGIHDAAQAYRVRTLN